MMDPVLGSILSRLVPAERGLTCLPQVAGASLGATWAMASWTHSVISRPSVTACDAHVAGYTGLSTVPSLVMMSMQSKKPSLRGNPGGKHQRSPLVTADQT